MNFNNYVSLNINGNSYSVSASYADDGTLTILADYSQNIEGLPTTLTVSYDSTKVGVTGNTLSFNMVGYN